MKNAAPINENRAELNTSILAQVQLPLFPVVAHIDFAGTDNPRYLRIIDALLKQSYLRRAEVDQIAGCANGPDLMQRLRSKGLSWTCRRVHHRDVDGNTTFCGIYSLTAIGRRQLHDWLRKSGQHHA